MDKEEKKILDKINVVARIDGLEDVTPESEIPRFEKTKQISVTMITFRPQNTTDGMEEQFLQELKVRIEEAISYRREDRFQSKLVGVSGLD